MTNLRIAFLIVVVVGGAACGKDKGKAPTPSAKPAEQGSNAAAAAPAPAAPAAATPKIGPIDLTAKSVDLVALFADATVELFPAGENAMFEADTVVVTRTGKLLASIKLDANGAITEISVLDDSVTVSGIGSVATSGINVGEPVVWTAPAGGGPIVANKPPVRHAATSADELDRCAREYRALVACGVDGWDPQNGWIHEEAHTITLKKAREECVASGMPVLDAGTVAKLEAAKNCDEAQSAIGLVSGKDF